MSLFNGVKLILLVPAESFAPYMLKYHLSIPVVESTALLYGTSDTSTVGKYRPTFIVLKYLKSYFHFQILRKYIFEQILMAL